MEEIFIAIMERIAEKMPELSYIDEDYGQLEAGAEEDHYPVTFPCVLVGNAESDWNDLGYGVQKSESLITIRLAIDCYDDTHYTSGTYNKVRERQLKAKELYKALQEFQCTEETSPLVRVKSRDYSLPGNIKVYETVYSFTLHDESAMTCGAMFFVFSITTTGRMRARYGARHRSRHVYGNSSSPRSCTPRCSHGRGP